MASGKLPPRQKMIGMMYLVLTALLAMNVSKDILNAFVVVNSSLIKTNDVLMEKNLSTMADFSAARAKDPEKATFFYEKAVEAQRISKELLDHIDTLKAKLIMETDKIDDKAAADSLMVKLQYVESKDNYDIPTSVMIGSEPANPVKHEFSAVDLKNRIIDTREKFLALYKPEDKFNPMLVAPAVNSIKAGLDIPEKVKVSESEEQSWESANFYHLPLAAVITNLSKIQTDIRSVEADVLKSMLASVKGSDFTFDQLTAKVIAPTSYVLRGSEYTADVLLVAFNSTQSPTIYVGQVDSAAENKMSAIRDTLPVEGGLGKIKVPATSVGEQNIEGVIKIEKPGGGFDYYPFQSSYMVAEPALVVSPVKMNVLYIGVDNPIAISVPGVASEKIKPTISNGALTPSNKKGEYIARVRGGTAAKVSVSAEMNGETVNMGSFDFRVKRVPDPVAKFAGKKGSATASKNELSNAAGVIAEMENFDFDLKFDVVEFTITANIGGYEKSAKSNGFRVSGEQKDIIRAAKPGSKVFVERVRAKGPDGSIRDLSPIVFTVR